MKRLLLSISAMVIASSLFASPAEESAEVEREHTLPEFDVVSMKQYGSLDDQPVSATVVGIGEVQLNEITDIKTLSDLVPNFYIPNYGSRITSSIYVRGLGARMDQPVTGLNIDNLPVLNKDAYDLDIPDIDYIQMLRGPQSILYGRNTMAGLINVYTLSPLKWQGIRLMGEVFSRGSFRIRGGWYHKFNQNTGLSANIALNSIHGQYRNAYNNSTIGDEKSGSARLKFEWKPSSVLSLLNTFSTSMVKQNGYPYEYVKTQEINYNDTCFYRRFLLNDALTLKFDFDHWSLSSISSVQYLNDNMTIDNDFLPDPYFVLTQKKKEITVTEELLAQRSGNHAYHWLAGFFGFYRHLDMFAPVTFKDTGINSLIESHRNDANPYYPILWDSRNFVLNSDFKLPSFGLAVYHESRYNVGNWKFSAGIRLDYEKIIMDYRSFTNTSYTIYSNPSGLPDVPFSQLEPYRTVPIDIDDTGHLTNNYLTLLPKVSALYELPDALGNVYATIGKGYKAGGFNTNMFSDVLQQRLMSIMGFGAAYSPEDIVKYRPEYSFNYEVGSHLDLGEKGPWRELTLDLSLFYIDCRDQQLTMYPDGTTTGRIMTNAGKTRSFGGELSLMCNPWSTLELRTSYGYTNARFVRFNNGINNYAGKRLPYAPSNTFFAQCLYTFQGNRLGNKNVILDVNCRGTGSIYWNEENSLRQPFYALLGASVTLQDPKWEIQVWGRNLTDTRFYTFYFMSMGNEFIQRGEKISFGATLRLFI